ncbi:MAG TPA: hypothetical protein VLE96_01195 [Chlamydiales bacterium]|nr:hypothetical protein [Chlamydiales bacterium]
MSCIAYKITEIKTGRFTTITTDRPNDYAIGQFVQCKIPQEFGIQELNNKTGVIVARIFDHQLILNIDSTNFEAFIHPTFYNLNPPAIFIACAKEPIKEAKPKAEKKPNSVLPAHYYRLAKTIDQN